MKSVACPYCQTELVGNFQSGDVIECDSCKGRFQPPPAFLKEYYPRRIVCPYCKTTLKDSVWSERFIQCPVCKGQFEKAETKERISVPRPREIGIGTGLLGLLTILGSVFFVVMFADGRFSQRVFLMEKAVRSSIVSFPVALFSTWIAWAIFKGRNWPRLLANVGVPFTMLFAILQTALQFMIDHHNRSVESTELCLLYSIDLLIKLFLGIGILCCLNKRQSRLWLHLPRSNKHSHDFPWWTIVLLFVLLCPILLLIAPSSSRKNSFSRNQNGKVQTSLARSFSSSLRQRSNRDDSYYRRAQYLSETLSKIKASDGDTPEALYSTAKGFGIEGKPLSRWFETVQSERFVLNANQTTQGRTTFDEVETAILTAAGQRGLLSSNLDDIDDGPVWLSDFGIIRDREDLNLGRKWDAERREQQTDIVRKIDFLKRESDGDDPAKGFYGLSLNQLRSAALSSDVRNRGDSSMQKEWDRLVTDVNNRYWNGCAEFGFHKEDVEESGLARKAVSVFLRNPAAAKSLLMVRIPETDYMLGRYEVTQALWQEVMDENPAHIIGETLPVENVSWNDCQVFLKKLNELLRMKEAGLSIRLPTKEEWNYAARAGSAGDYCRCADGTEILTDTLGHVAWYDDNSNNTIHPIGQKAPNAFGLFDVFGNVEEWTQTPIDDGYSIRGGGYFTLDKWCKTSEGVFLSPNERDEGLGLRLCATVNPEEHK